MDDESIGPINGHNKSEALPLGCAMFVAAVVLFILVFGTYGFIADAMKVMRQI